MESRIINIPKCKYYDHYLVVSYILVGYQIHYTFSECYLDFKNYLIKAKREFHINFLEMIKIGNEISNVNSYPTTQDGTGLFETVYQFKTSVLIMNLTYRDIWKFDNKPMMSSHDMPGKITLSDEVILHINLLLKKEEYVIVFNKLDNSLKLSLPVGSKIKESDLMELFA